MHRAPPKSENKNRKKKIQFKRNSNKKTWNFYKSFSMKPSLTNGKKYYSILTNTVIISGNKISSNDLKKNILVNRFLYIALIDDFHTQQRGIQ